MISMEGRRHKESRNLIVYILYVSRGVGVSLGYHANTYV